MARAIPIASGRVGRIPAYKKSAPARQKASAEAHLQLEEATRRIGEEKDKAIREVRTEIADLSVAIAEKVMKEKISRTDEQEKIINGLLDNVSFSKS